MNGWRSRLLVGLVMLLAMRLHAVALADVPNTPAGMLLYHGSAAVFDWSLLVLTPMILRGRLCDHMQTLNFVSMVINFMGWITYLAWTPPTVYNMLIAGLSYVQFIRLLLDDDAINTLRGFMVRRPDSGRAVAH